MNAVTNFMYYMYNRWCEEEAVEVFGSAMGQHLFGKWNGAGDELRWYSELDTENKNKIVERANEIYGI